MKTAQLIRFGDRPEFALNELPDPIPGENEVVVDLCAAALNRRDRWIWTTPDYCRLPVTLGSDGAGVISQVGSHVAGFSEGDEVVIYPSLGWSRGEQVPGPDFDILGAPTPGTFAEKICVPAENVRLRPGRLTWRESAAFPLAGLTAWRASQTCGQVGPGSTVLVTGAGSGVSTFVLQLCVALGARVVVTTGSPEKRDRALSLGAEGALLYTDTTWPEQLRDTFGPLDVVVDSYGAETLARGLSVLRRGGRYVLFGDTGGPTATITASDIYWEWRSLIGTTMGSPEEFDALLEHIGTALWRPVIDSVYPLEQIADASERLLDSARFGKVVVQIGE